MNLPPVGSAIAVSVLVSGRVQGVFFRSGLANVAKSNSVVGWVRNQENGCVEAVIQGRKLDVDRVVEWCHRGPERAKVDHVQVVETSIQANLRDFTIIY